MRQRSRTNRYARWLLAGFMAAILALVVAIGVSAAVPIGCGSCHEPNTSGDANRYSHEDVGCLDCHGASPAGSRITFASYQILGMVLGIIEPQGRGISGVEDLICLRCHSTVLSDGTLSSKGKRIDHATCMNSKPCTGCHSTVAHGSSAGWVRTYQMSDCLECHNAREVFANCDRCHDSRTENERLGTGAWAVTHGKTWKTTHGMGNSATCAACHRNGFCTKCHGIDLPHSETFFGLHGEEAIGKPAACESCHQPKFCSDCHGIDMPHDKDFTPDHPELVKRGSGVVCDNCHVKDDCVTCHVKHVHPGGAIRSFGSSGAGVP